MPSKAPSYCYGCRKKVTDPCDKPNCPKNTSKFKNKKGNVHPFYQSSEWRGNPNKPLGQRDGLREDQLIRKPNCEECEKEGVYKQATVVDHIKDWKGGRNETERQRLFKDPDNHRSLCQSHHNAKTGRTNK